ncbi:super-infection exclusion protein B [Agarivorans sp. MS3-6]|uniref:super-infection exclusion protein B n=1 Tax=Agarivorans sp. TSD2052 TaxID=2937286 RepID=UPI00200C61C5|nr:super-infection exclusion protein B [Agarivorans sp. TSD2052]UPW19415.1 superinfection exclusion B family protein [Agarivorans sp. TSD2052]
MEFLSRLIARWGVLDVLMAWLVVASGLLLVIPKQWLPEAGLNPQLSLVLTISCVAGLAYFISRSLLLLVASLSRSMQHRRELHRLSSMVACLDHSERAVLREFVITRRTVLSLPLAEPAVMNLMENGVLKPMNMQHVQEQRTNVDMMINLAARPLLSYKALGLPVGKLNEEQIEHLKSIRPRFLQADYKANRTHSGKLFRIRAGDEESRTAA